MDEQMQLERGRKIYEALCQHLDKMDLRYNKEEEKLRVDFRVSGEDLPINIIMVVDSSRSVIQILSPLSFRMSEEKRIEGAIAVAAMNYLFVDGSFDYDLNKGIIAFRATARYFTDTVDDELFHYLIGMTYSVVDKYNDILLGLDKGMMSLEDVLKFVDSGN